MSGNQQNGLYLSKWTWILHVKIKLLIISSFWNSVAQSRSWEADRKTSGRCHCGPASPAGKCFCPPRSSSSGSWFGEEQCSSVRINLWPLLLLPAPILLLPVSFSLSPFVHWPVSWRLSDGALDGGWRFHKNTVWWMLSKLRSQSLYSAPLMSPSSFQLRLLLLSHLNAWRVEGGGRRLLIHACYWRGWTAD